MFTPCQYQDSARAVGRPFRMNHSGVVSLAMNAYHFRAVSMAMNAYQSRAAATAGRA